MNNAKNPKQYDLEERTFQFAKDVRLFIKKLPKTLTIIEDGKQLIRSSGSVGANYIEANEALSKKDFVYRIRVCRKETKESNLWLRLLDTGANDSLIREKQTLIDEAIELRKIYSSIFNKSN